MDVASQYILLKQKDTPCKYTDLRFVSLGLNQQTETQVLQNNGVYTGLSALPGYISFVIIML